MLVALLVVPSLQTMSKVFRNTRKVTFSEVLLQYIIFSVRLRKYPYHLLEIEAKEIGHKKYSNSAREWWFNNCIVV